ncbi:phage protease [Mycobacteroides chelonae]|uniref:Mu-like prophage I protein n=1 Tax=Mycobacteroides chelonae TaxID=1774 RepID=A0A1S1M3Y7_MYCCH|nr:phage protease [Mycobacteroides chelonae]OHU78006.1 hypothetical protein BKG84_05985 [Mycobacteroides chelonae]QQG86816.1 hypothetical protein HBA99_05905 [Mycobacteroides chelonae]QQG91632.1 hypothetical protein HBA97_05905 [Mycobacteroides chelonae]
MALTLDDQRTADLLDTLGLPADTTDTALILATVKDAITETPTATAAPSAIAAAAKKAGLEVLDTDTATALRAEAAEGRHIKAAAARQKIEDTVDAAVAKGKITAARRKHWVDLITADPAMSEVLASVPDETAISFTEIGHSVGTENGEPPANGSWFY